MIRAALVLVLGLLATPALAQADAATAARLAAERLDRAARQLDAADGARDRIRAMTETIRAYEDGLGALRDSLRRAGLREAAIRGEFDREAARLGRLLGVLETIGGRDLPPLILHPDGALGTARSAMLVAEVTPAVAARAVELRRSLQELQTLRALQESAGSILEDGLAGLQTARTGLSLAMSERRELPRRFTEDPAQMQALIRGAETLEAFASGLATLPDDPLDQTLPDFATARGNLPLPVAGRLRRGFRESDAAGNLRPGWIWETRPGALVTAPWPATLRYRGPLLNYGIVMLLEPQAGYLIVVAGLDVAYGEAGEIISEGSPLGFMPRSGQNGADGGRQDGQAFPEALYIEIREGGVPVDPRDWFRQSED